MVASSCILVESSDTCPRAPSAIERAEAVSLTFRDAWLICVMLAARPDAIASPAASSDARLIRDPDESCVNARESAVCVRDTLKTDEELNPTAVRPLDIH
jgi:hypothetical protein